MHREWAGYNQRVGPEHIVARLKAIRDGRMRVLSVVESLGEGDPTAWIDAIASLLARAHTVGDADAALAVQSITQAAAEASLSYDTRKRLYEAAIARGAPAIARLFIAVSPAVELPATLVKQLGPERPLRPSGKPLTLGERKALARTHDRQQILLLLADPHPAVVAILLDNPHVTESDVLKLSSRRPAVPATLLRVAAHPRWSVRHAVKRALAQNPSMPLADAIRIVTTLRISELAELAEDPALPEPLRMHAAEIRATSLRRPQA